MNQNCYVTIESLQKSQKDDSFHVREVSLWNCHISDASSVTPCDVSRKIMDITLGFCYVYNIDPRKALAENSIPTYSSDNVLSNFWYFDLFLMLAASAGRQLSH